MKNYIPRYDKRLGELENIYNNLKPVDKKIISNQILRWETTAGKGKVNSKKSNLIKIADILETGLNKISKENYFKLSALIRNSDLADSTKNDLRKYFKEFLRDYYPDWNIRFGNLKELKLQKENIPKKYEELPTPNQIKSLIPKTPDLQIKNYIAVSTDTCARGSEILNSKWGDWNEAEGTLKLVSTKNKNVRVIPLNEANQHLRRWKKEYIFQFPSRDDYIFVDPHNRERHLTIDFINGKLNRLGLDNLGKPLTTYCLRHIFCTNLQKKLPAKVYEKVADHSIDTATRYSHLNNDDIKEAMNEFVYKVEELEPTKNLELMEKLKEELRLEIVDDIMTNLKKLYKFTPTEEYYKIMNKHK